MLVVRQADRRFNTRETLWGSGKRQILSARAEAQALSPLRAATVPLPRAGEEIRDARGRVWETDWAKSSGISPGTLCRAQGFHGPIGNFVGVPMKRLLTSLIAAAGLTLGLAAQAEARTNFDLYLGVPFGGYGYGPAYGYGNGYGFDPGYGYGFYDEPYYYPRRHFRHRFREGYGFYEPPRRHHRWHRRHRHRNWN
jgi:hypothetical protein